jgi:hypothetical protein
MGAEAPLSIAPAAPEVVCAAGDGCSYLRTLSAIERIAGFEHTARRYLAAAARCREHGCKAASATVGRAAAPVLVADPVPLKSVAASSRCPDPAQRGAAAEPIPFSRSAWVDILSDRDGNFVERRQLKPETLPAKNDGLGYLYRYWADLRAAGALCFSNIDTVHLARAGVIGSLHIVDVASGDPNDFHFDLFGYAVPLDRLERPRALPVQIYADTTLRDYNTVRLTGVPQLHRIHCRLGDTMHHYTRLILPFLDESDRVTRLCVAIRQERGNSLKVETRQ